MTAVEYLKMLGYIGVVAGGFTLLGLLELPLLLLYYKLKDKIKEKGDKR